MQSETQIRSIREKSLSKNERFEDALENLGLKSGPGSDGNLPTRLMHARIARMVGSRQDEGQGCQDIEAEWKNFNSSADKAVPGLEGQLNTTETDTAISSLNKLNNR